MEQAIDAESLAREFLHKYWMAKSVSERVMTCGGLYSAEKAILERLAPNELSATELMEFVFYHMHGCQIEEMFPPGE
jgi:hypothetical protein